MANPIQEKVETTKSSRPVYVYQIPKLMADGITSIGLVQLTTHEEMMAAKRAGSDPVKYVYEQAKQSLVEVNGEKVSLGDGSTEQALDRMGPQIRSLMMTAFGKLHSPPEDTTADFLNTQSVKVA
jgi:hypothetical protein